MLIKPFPICTHVVPNVIRLDDVPMVSETGAEEHATASTTRLTNAATTHAHSSSPTFFLVRAALLP